MASQTLKQELQRARSSSLRTGKSAFDLAGLHDALPRQRHFPTPTPPLLRLPAELRLHIYSLALEQPLAHQRAVDRARIRIAWPSQIKSQVEPTSTFTTLRSLLTLHPTTRSELLPHFHRTTILKFPAWNPDYKAKCFEYIDGCSEGFIRGLQWIWFEGVYWRFSLRFEVGREGEDEKATREDVHRYEETEYFESSSGEIVLRLDFVKQMRSQAQSAAHELLDVVDATGSPEVLTKAMLSRLLLASRLTVAEQLSDLSHRNYGIRTVYPPR